MVKAVRVRLRLTLILLLGLVLVAAAGRVATLNVRLSASNDDRLPVVAVPGYHVSLFTSASAIAEGKAPVKGPDSLAVSGNRVYIDYQNVTSKTGGDGKFSTVVEYNMEGRELRRWSVSGHSDGLRIDPATHKVWTTSNEDGNPTFALIDPVANSVTVYTFPMPTPHGGGYDDLYFLGGKAYIAASNPSSSPNTAPAVDQITLNPNHTISLTPILMGNAAATDAATGQAVTLNLQDPDSLSTDGTGALVLISQGDSQIITIANPGASNQSVKVLNVGTQLEDTVYPSGKGRLLVVDGGGSTYWISKNTAFAAGSIYSQAPNDSGVANWVGIVNPVPNTSSGLIVTTPLAVGFTKATGMVFVPDSGNSESDN
jgi:hypothetical protein